MRSHLKRERSHSNKMADDELEAIRARRMAELQQQMGGGGKEDQQERMQQQEMMKNSILSQVLTQEARARLNTIALAKPDKAKMIENMLCQMAQSGQIQSKLDEDQFKGILEKVSGQAQKTTVKFDRRRAALDSDSD